MPAISIKQSAAGAVKEAKKISGGADGPLKQALDRFLNTPSMGLWDQYLLQLQTTAPWIGFDDSDIDDRITSNILKGGRRRRKIHPPHTAFNYQSSSDLSGGVSSALGGMVTINMPSPQNMARTMNPGATSLNGVNYPLSLLNSLRDQASSVARLSQQAVGSSLVPMDMFRGSDVTAAIKDSDVQLKKISQIVAKQYDLERLVAMRSMIGGNQKLLGYEGKVALEGIYTPFREVNEPRLGFDQTPLLSGPRQSWRWPWPNRNFRSSEWQWPWPGRQFNSSSTEMTLEGIYTPFREVNTRRIGGGGWGGFGNFLGSMAGSFGGSYIGGGGGGGPRSPGQFIAAARANWGGGTAMTAPGWGPWWGGGGGGPGGGGGGIGPGGGGPGFNLPFNPYGLNTTFGGSPSWLTKGVTWGLAGVGAVLEAGDIAKFIQNRAAPAFEYKENMFGIARAMGGGGMAGQQAMETLFPGLTNKGGYSPRSNPSSSLWNRLVRDFPVLAGFQKFTPSNPEPQQPTSGEFLKDWQLTYGVGPLSASRMLKAFPMLPGQGTIDMNRMGMGLAKVPYLPGFSGLDSDMVRRQLGYIASALPENRWQDPLTAGASLAPYLEIAGSFLPRQNMLDTARSIMDMQIAAGGVNINPEAILSRTINIGALNTPGARLGITQQNIVSQQENAVQNIGRSPMQNFAATKLIMDMKQKGVRGVLGDEAYRQLLSNKATAPILQNVETSLKSGMYGAAFGFLPSLLEASGSQYLLTQAGAGIAEQMFPGDSMKPWRDLAAIQLSGMRPQEYFANQAVPGGGVGGGGGGPGDRGMTAPSGWFPAYAPGQAEAAKSIMGGLGLDAKTQDLVLKLSAQEGVDPTFVLAIMKKENGFTRTRGSSGEYGLMQVMPGSEPGYSPAELNTDEGNISAGIKRFKQYFYKYAGGDVKTAMAMYNTGPKGYSTHTAVGNAYAADEWADYMELRKKEGIEGTPAGLPDEVLRNRAITEAQQVGSAGGWGTIAATLTDAGAALSKAGMEIQQMASNSSEFPQFKKGGVPSSTPGSRGR